MAHAPRESVVSDSPTAVERNISEKPRVDDKSGDKSHVDEKRDTLDDKSWKPAGLRETHKKLDDEGDETVRVRDAADSESLKTIETGNLTWQQATFLLFGEYIVIAILSFPSSYSVLGMAGGVLTTFILGIVTLWTSHILWRYCMQNPHLTDICTIGWELFGRNRWAYELTTFGFLLNNLFIMGLHTLAGTIALNTLSDHATCTIVWSVIFLVVMFCFSLTRELKSVALMTMTAAATMLIALILTLAFAGAESGPAGATPDAPPTYRVWAAPGASFKSVWNAVLNITYTYVGQVLVPTYVYDMKNPQDFPKALFACTILEIILFTIGGAVILYYVGDQYVTSPVYGSLQRTMAKIVAGFTIPTILVVGILYAVVTSRTIYYRIFGPSSVHAQKVTKRGTIVWVIIVACVWFGAWVIGEAIPFFNDLLSLMSTLFDCWFGFIFWGVAFFRLYPRGNRFTTPWRKIEACFSVLMVVTGLFVLGAGGYSSIAAISDSYSAGTVAGAFTCDNNGF